VLVISPRARISKLADIEDSVQGSRIVIEDDVFIDAFVKIKPAGGVGDVVIGAGSYVNAGTVIYSGNGVTIGKNVLIAANVTLAATNHEYRSKDQLIVKQRFLPSKGGITIGDDSWIGAGAVVLDGAQIGTGCVLGALSLARGQFEPWGVYAGNPAKLIGART